MKKTTDLAPTYIVSFKHRGVAGDNCFHLSSRLSDYAWQKLIETSDERFPERERAKTFSKAGALAAAKSLHLSPLSDTGALILGQVAREDISDITVSHYGFRGRGFRAGEKREKCVAIA